MVCDYLAKVQAGAGAALTGSFLIAWLCAWPFYSAHRRILQKAGTR